MNTPRQVEIPAILQPAARKRSQMSAFFERQQ